MSDKITPPPLVVVLLPVLVERGERRVVHDADGRPVGDRVIPTGAPELRFVDVSAPAPRTEP